MISGERRGADVAVVHDLRVKQAVEPEEGPIGLADVRLARQGPRQEELRQDDGQSKRRGKDGARGLRPVIRRRLRRIAHEARRPSPLGSCRLEYAA